MTADYEREQTGVQRVQTIISSVSAPVKAMRYAVQYSFGADAIASGVFWREKSRTAGGEALAALKVPNPAPKVNFSG